MEIKMLKYVREMGNDHQPASSFYEKNGRNNSS